MEPGSANGRQSGSGNAGADQLPVLVLPELPDARVILFRGSTRVYSHYNDTYSIATIFQCRSEISFRGRRHVATPHVVGMMEPDGIFRHVCIPVPETVGKLHITPSAFEDAARELGVRGGPLQFKTVLLANHELFRCLAQFHLSLESDSAVLERQSRFAECVRLLVQYGVDRAPAMRFGHERTAVRRARELLHARFAERVTLGELSSAAGLSVFHLSRVFTREVGISPHAYQNHLRIAKARECLARGVPACETAVHVGFTDQSHLTRQFRRTLGFTPGSYARGTPKG